MSLKIGDKLPNFSAKDTNGNIFNSLDYIGKQPLVIYFYPKDDTPGCTAQACSFRDNYQEFKDLGAEVVGISSDTVTSHLKFKSKFNLPFILLSDNDKKLRKLFGVQNNLFIIPGRETFVMDKNGIILMIFNSMSAEIHIEKALKTLKELVK
jgi:peroxiredoxin Q/BCP